MWFNLMMFCWALSEMSIIFHPFSWFGDWMEDIGLDQNWIRVKLHKEGPR